MILILSHPDDPHARAVCDHLRPVGAPHAVLDLSLYPRQARLTLQQGQGASSIRWDGAGQSLDLENVRAVWAFRPQPFGFDASLQANDFARAECNALFAGLWQALPAQWLNPPLLDEAAGRKSWQLALAGELGLCPPETLMTNDPDQARDFVERLGDVVYKPFGTGLTQWRQARRFGISEMAPLHQLRHVPSIFQERIGGEQIRVTVVGDRIFAAGIDSGATPVAQQTIHEKTLPASLKDAIRALMGRMGLGFGTLDFRHDPAKGGYRFLKMNPAGPWLFVEEQTRQPIARAVADLLMRMAQGGLS